MTEDQTPSCIREGVPTEPEETVDPESEDLGAIYKAAMDSRPTEGKPQKRGRARDLWRAREAARLEKASSDDESS